MRALWVAVLLCLSITANAGREVSPEVRARARASFELGRRLYRLTQFKEALESFAEAYKLLEEPAFIYNIAQCRRQLGQDEEAMRAYESYMAIAPPDDEARQDVDVFIRDLAVRIARKHADEERARRDAEEHALVKTRAREILEAAEQLQAQRNAPHYTPERSRALIVSGSVLAFVGLGLVGGGIGTALSLHDASDALRAEAALQTKFDVETERRRDRALSATISLFSIGGAMAITGAALLGRGMVERRIVERERR